MTKNELWETYADQYPQFQDDENIVKLRSRGLRRLMDQAWDEGYDRGLEESLRRQAQKRNQFPSNPFSSIFG